MKKIYTLDQLKKIILDRKAEGKEIGLITGCFDIVHPGHIGLFRFAKKHCDILVVGLENDETLRLSKGKFRPIFRLKERLEFLSEILSIDYVFPINIVTKLGAKNAGDPYDMILQTLRPDYLITNPEHDNYWKAKMVKIKKFGGKILLEKTKVNVSTSKIAEVIVKKFS
jgi:D-beta-D-heptose 7-phosphate kinase / D-beta-D-heptose 1-phosphate adenosyltransferase